MLVLTRKSEEKIVIGKNKEIIITILKIHRDKVSIGIEADGEPIMREELVKKEIELSNQRAALNKSNLSTKDLAKELQDKIKNKTVEEAEIPT